MQIPKKGTLARKLTLIILGSIAIAVVTFTVAILFSGSWSFRSLMRSKLVTLADIVGQNSTAALTFGDVAAADEVLGALRADNAIVSACLFDGNGRIFAKYQRDADAKSCPEDFARMPAADPLYETLMRPVLRKDELVGSLLLTSDMQDLRRRMRNLLSLSAGLLVLTMLLGGLFGTSLQRKVSDPISQLVKAMSAVTSEQRYETRVNVESAEEINALGAGFNAMLAEIEHREDELRQRREELELS